MLLSGWALLAAAACSADCGSVPNPTGDCTTPSEGGHCGYNAADDCSWVRDCKLQLEREYWRVYVDVDAPEHAFMVPRPDGTDCLPAEKRRMPDINDLTLEQALSAAHCLHDRLRFEVTSLDPSSGVAGFDITPTALPDDKAAVCERFPALATGVLEPTCSSCMVQACRSRLSFGTCANVYRPIATEAEATTLAARLNQIYGIE